VTLARTLIVPAALAALAATWLAPRAGATAVPSCVPARLSASFGGQGTTQSLLGEVAVTNHGRTACRLSSRPVIGFPGGSPHEVLRERATNTLGVFPGERFSATLVLDPGHTAAVWFQWMNWCNPAASGPAGATALGGRRPSQVLVRIAPGAPAIVATVSGGLRALYLPVCNDPKIPSQISVSRWTSG
jgi:hypothetical protein